MNGVEFFSSFVPAADQQNSLQVFAVRDSKRGLKACPGDYGMAEMITSSDDAESQPLSMMRKFFRPVECCMRDRTSS